MYELTVLFLLFPKFQAAEKLQKEVVRLFVELDSSLVKVKDQKGRLPSDLVFLERTCLVKFAVVTRNKIILVRNLFLTRCSLFLRYGTAFSC